MSAPASNSVRAFKLRGKTYRLSKTDVERAVAKVEPRPTEKYAVMIGSRAYPPKQLIEAALHLPPMAFTTMDAQRILGRLGFEVLASERPSSTRTALQRWQPSVPTPQSDQKNQEMREMVDLLAPPEQDDRWMRLRSWFRDAVSETRAKDLFEAYLFASGLEGLKVQREPQEFGGIVDFIISLHEKRIAFEVNELVPVDLDIGSEVELHDPSRPIRERIGAAELELQTVKESCRCLVLYSRCLPWPLFDWRFIYWSMQGSGEITRNPLALARLENSSQQSTGLDAVVVLDQMRSGYIRFQAQIAAQESKLKRSMTTSEYMSELQRARGTERDIFLSRLRVIVHESANAQNPLPKDIFRGPYDEWYGVKDDGQIGRMFVGEEIQSLETENRGSTAS